MFLSILVALLGLGYLILCIAFIVIPIIIIWDNHSEHKAQGDALMFGAITIFFGVIGLLFALAVFTGDINITPNSDVPKQGCWKVTTTRELVGKTTQDVRHWETIRCP